MGGKTRIFFKRKHMIPGRYTIFANGYNEFPGYTLKT